MVVGTAPVIHEAGAQQLGRTPMTPKTRPHIPQKVGSPSPTADESPSSFRPDREPSLRPRDIQPRRPLQVPIKTGESHHGTAPVDGLDSTTGERTQLQTAIEPNLLPNTIPSPNDRGQELVKHPSIPPPSPPPESPATPKRLDTSRDAGRSRRRRQQGSSA